MYIYTTPFFLLPSFKQTAQQLTVQVERLAAVLPEFLENQTQHRGWSPAVLPVRCALVVQDDRVGFTPSDELLLVFVVGDDGPDGYVALLEPPQHEPRYGQVDGALDVRRLVQLMRTTVQQEQRGAPGL